MILSVSTSEVSPAVRILHLNGMLSAVTYHGLEKEILRVIDEGATLLVLDLQGLEFLGSTGIRVLLQALKTLRAKGGDVRTMQVPKAIQEVFDLVQLFPASQAFANKAELQAFLAPVK
jgi:anti-anti-sigma factor